MKKNIEVKNVIVKSAADVFLPLALVLGFYVILHGNISPGGGFQGGVIVASAAILLYLGYGYGTTAKALKPEFIRKNEAVAAVCYVTLALLGIFMGANFCRNVFFDNGNIGDLFSAGTISFMNYAVGYKVLTGVSFLLLLMLGLLGPGDGEENETK
ncbi:MAG: MnhB domain-containing protein [Oscillospiraceae bacterium]